MTDEFDEANQRAANERPEWSVEEFVSFLKEALGRIGPVRVKGEVSSVSSGPTGHAYFTLTDKKREAELRCVMWKSAYEVSGVKLEAGMEVVVSGSPDVYVPRGSLSFVARTVELAGEGALRRAYEELKQKLAAQGMFDEEKKRQLPAFPSQVGVITSLRSGTVVHDFTNNLGPFGFRVRAVDARVEGKEAIHSLLSAFDVMEREDIDVLLVMRGGGSVESLQAFDSEAVVRRVRSFGVPVVAAVGHHMDVPLAALAADKAVSTPTAAAHLLNSSWERLASSLLLSERSLVHALEGGMRETEKRVAALQEGVLSGFRGVLDAFGNLERRLARQAVRSGVRAAQDGQAAVRAWAVLSETYKRSLDRTLRFGERTEAFLRAVSPERNLRLGYSIVTGKDGKVVRTTKQLSEGDRVVSRVSDGAFASLVEKITHGG